MKKYLKVVVTTKTGRKFNNELKLSEAYLVSKMAQENAKLEITLKECDAKMYSLIFG